jgi:pre-mRNA-splicing factor SYF1
VWHDFEVKHGNEDTFREMLRIKRSIQAQFNTQVNFMSAQMMAGGQQGAATGTTIGGVNEDLDEMAELERKARQMAEDAERDQPRLKRDVLFVRGSEPTQELEDTIKSANPEEIVLDDEEGEQETAPVEEVQLEKKVVPSAVFQGLVDEEGKPTAGAWKRLSKRKK